MKYEKLGRTFEEQADLLLSRGLEASKADLVTRLKATNYFRLTTYLYPFRRSDSDQFEAGTTLEKVWQRYRFDQRLRTLVLDAIEGIEVYVRTQLAYYFALDSGAFAYTDQKHFPNLPRERFLEWQRKLDDQTQRSLASREDFVVHFFDKYGDEHTRLPIWVMIELMDFGSTLTFFRGVSDNIKKRIANEIGVPDRVLWSWLLALNTVRNRCAHHSRLWDWELGTPVLLPQERKFPDWHAAKLPNNRTGIILTICKFWTEQIAPSNRWPQRVRDLLAEFPELPIAPMGLPDEWLNHPLWREESR